MKEERKSHRVVLATILLAVSCLMPSVTVLQVSADRGGHGRPSLRSRRLRASSQPQFDVCMQDDTSRDMLQVNSGTGDYLLTRCLDGFKLSGKGVLTIKGCGVFLEHTPAGGRVLARIDTCKRTAIASVQIRSSGTTLNILDRDISDNACACPLPPGTAVEEVPSGAPPSGDPVVRGDAFDPSILSQHVTPLEFQNEPAFDLADKTIFLPVAKVELGPNASREIIVAINEPTLLLARVNWAGSAGPVRLLVSRGGITVVTGMPIQLPPNRGVVSARADLAASGNIVVSAINDGNVPVAIDMVVGTIAKTFLR